MNVMVTWLIFSLPKKGDMGVCTKTKVILDDNVIAFDIIIRLMLFHRKSTFSTMRKILTPFPSQERKILMKKMILQKLTFSVKLILMQKIGQTSIPYRSGNQT